ncbi:MAG: hypothetical protein QOG97_1656 [Acidimicrobiaceae bacterium]|nr:hypothetical protein [Acidimicrobiaceae bacterium]
MGGPGCRRRRVVSSLALGGDDVPSKCFVGRDDNGRERASLRRPDERARPWVSCLGAPSAMLVVLEVGPRSTLTWGAMNRGSVTFTPSEG